MADRWKAEIQGGNFWAVDNGRRIIAHNLSKSDAMMIASALNWYHTSTPWTKAQPPSNSPEGEGR